MKKFIIALISIFVFGLGQCITLAQDQDINPNIEFIAYVNRLENSVKSNWVLPHGKFDKKTVILLDIDKKGKLLGANVVNFSGDKDFDKNAMEAVIQSAPFEGFPQTITDEKATIKITFDQREFEASAVTNVTVSDNNNDNNIADANVCPVAEKKSAVISKNNPLVMMPYHYQVRPYYYYYHRPQYYYQSYRSNFYNHHRPDYNHYSPSYYSYNGPSYNHYQRPYYSYYSPYHPPVVNNNYYTEVPSDFSSPVTKFWAADRLIWLSFLIAHVCAHGI